MNNLGYPEHDRLDKVFADSQIIGDFLNWLSDEHVMLCNCDDQHGYLQPINKSITDLLAKYFAIDLTKLETEKQAMLEALRQVQERERKRFEQSILTSWKKEVKP